ncbi:MAG: FAD binding domain-containing protein [Enterocloster bolteae]
MVLPQFEYLAPKTIGEACNLLLELGSTARVMAGATDLIPPMKDKVISPEYIIDLKKIPGLDYLEYDDREGLKIGALTTLRTIETSPLVKEKNPAVAHAAKVVASTQIRTKGTMAGNICNASPSCDTAPNLLAQGAKILVQGPNKDRVIQMEDFFLGVKKTSLEPGEIVTGIVIPPLAENERAAYIKHAVRKAMDLAIIGVAVKITGGRRRLHRRRDCPGRGCGHAGTGAQGGGSPDWQRTYR